MSEPFIRPAFKEFAKQKWAAYDDEIDAITTQEGLSRLLQKKLNISALEAEKQITRAFAEFEGK